MTDNDSINISSSQSSPSSSRDHIRKALKVLHDGRLSFVDLLCIVLDPTERDFRGYREALYSSPTNGSPIKLHRVLDHILEDTRGAQLFRQWMEPRAIQIASNNIHRESDPVREGLRGQSSTVTPEVLRTSELNSSRVANTTLRAPKPTPPSRIPSSTTHSNSHSTHPSHTSHKPHTDEFYFPRPESDEVIEIRFARIARQRDLPDHLSINQKWPIVYAAEQMRWEAERDRGDNARKQRATEQATLFREGSPEWYICKFMNGTITAKEVSGVWVSLRGHETGWLDKFIDYRGTAVLAQSLAQISCKSKRDPADIPLEQEIAKCLKVIFNSASRVREAMKIPNIVTQITSALNSPHLPTRRTITEVLLSIVYCNRDSLDLVFHGLATLSQANSDSTGCYDYWFQSLENVLRGRGKMSNYAGASGGGALVDYALINIGLMVHIMDVMDDLDVQICHRTAMDSAGLPRIVELCRELGVAAMDKQLDELATMLEEDEQRLRGRQDNAMLASFSNSKDI